MSVVSSSFGSLGSLSEDVNLDKDDVCPRGGCLMCGGSVTELAVVVSRQAPAGRTLTAWDISISLCAVLDRVFEDEQEDRENPLRTPIRRPGIERDVVSCVNEIVSENLFYDLLRPYERRDSFPVELVWIGRLMLTYRPANASF